MIEETASITLVYLSYMVFAAKRLMTYMHVLQQEDYYNDRLWKWMMDFKAYDKKLTFAFLILGGVSLTGYIPSFFMNFLVFICFAIGTYKEKDPRKNAKKKLVATTRAKRIYFPALALVFLLGVWCFYGGMPLFWIISVHLIPVALITVNAILKPVEDIIQQSYWNEAHAKLRQLNPIVIGITGSFGKTSVKHILGHILSSQAPTLMTPGSVNTPMGITRIIRERLDESHKYFIVEMGAYGPGSIARLCKLTPPHHGIISAIGHAHYERFRSLEAVSKAKFELAEAVIKKEGKVIIHEKTLRFAHPRHMRSEHLANFLVCGEPQNENAEEQEDVSYLEPGDVKITKLQQLKSGLEIELTVEEKTYNFVVPLFGLHHGHNIALAFSMALALKIEPYAAISALEKLPQIEHRLEVKKQPDGTLLIDDAYNSNPLGFRSALDLLAVFKQPNGRNILVTPGMVELGVAHNDVHDKIGRYAGEVCDVAIVVQPKRIPSFVKSFQASGKQLIQVETFNEASKWLAQNRQKGDIILLENDLPDMYERVPKM